MISSRRLLTAFSQWLLNPKIRLILAPFYWRFPVQPREPWLLISMLQFLIRVQILFVNSF
ncbi:hypothetical protein HanPI659440_Chr06g0227601 [Helianthus annuus]|nr:hypothetical protein HanPI659440_Chr06g0227601 [Helianthus annuus]